MAPNFSSLAFSFFALGEVTFRKQEPRTDDRTFQSDYRCQFRYADAQDSRVEVRVHFIGQDTARSGEDVAVLLAFLNWKRERTRCRVGRKFELCEGDAVVARGVVQAIGSS